MSQLESCGNDFFLFPFPNSRDRINFLFPFPFPYSRKHLNTCTPVLLFAFKKIYHHYTLASNDTIHCSEKIVLHRQRQWKRKFQKKTMMIQYCWMILTTVFSMTIMMIKKMIYVEAEYILLCILNELVHFFFGCKAFY